MSGTGDVGPPDGGAGGAAPGALAGGVGRARGRGFEWFVAWRHLRDNVGRSHRTLVLGIVLLVLAGGALVAAHLPAPAGRGADGFLRLRESLLVERLRMGGVAGLVAGGVVTYLGVLFSAFSVFTAISIFGVFLGTSAPIIALSVMSGFEADLKGKIRGAKADVVVTSATDRPFSDWRAVGARLARLPGVVATTPFLEGEVMVQSGSMTSGIVIRGIDPASAASVLDLARTLREGKVSALAAPRAGEARARPGIILGEELYARSLRVFVGSEVDVVCPLCKTGPTGPIPGLRTFRVVGHFYSGMYEYDSKLAYVSLEEAQRFLGAPGEVSGIDVRARSPDEARQLAAAVAAALGPAYDVRSWEELNRGLFTALRLEKIAMFVVLAFIALVASFSISSNLIMMVTQKGREVAILKAMGAGDGAVLRIFFAEGLYIGLLGLLVGVATGVLGCELIRRHGLPLPTDVYYIDRLPVVMRAGEIAGIGALALLLCCLATVYPAVLASRMRPAEGLRYE